MTSASEAQLVDEWEAARLIPWREELRYVEKCLRKVGRPICAHALMSEAIAWGDASRSVNWGDRRLLYLAVLERVEVWVEWWRYKTILRFQAVS